MPVLTDVAVDWVSLVDRPAVRDADDPSEPSRFLVWKAEAPARGGDLTRVTKSADLLLLKADRQIVYGIVLQPDIPDSQGDVLTASEIEKAAHRYLIESRKNDVQHNERQALTEVVESYVVSSPMTLNGRTVLKGSWVMGVHITDTGLWQRVTGGDLTGFSIGGTAARTPDQPAPAGHLSKQETTDMPKTAYDEALDRADALIKADPRLTKARAVDQIFKSDTALAQRYYVESRNPGRSAGLVTKAEEGVVASRDRLAKAMERMGATKQELLAAGLGPHTESVRKVDATLNELGREYQETFR